MQADNKMSDRAACNVQQSPKLSWLVEFRPMLQLLWSLLDFSDPAKVLEKKQSMWYTAPLTLMDFFLQRGILELDGLSIFRSYDFLNAEDANCKDLFHSSKFAETLEAICIHVAAKGGDDLPKEISNENNNCWWEFPSYIQETLCCVFDIGDTRELKQQVQHAQQSDLLKYGWLSLDAYLHFMSFLSLVDGASHDANAGAMVIPLELLACSQKACDSLTNVLKTEQFEKLHLEFKLSPRRFYDLDWYSLLQRFPGAYAACMKAIVEGFSLRGKLIKELLLQDLCLVKAENFCGDLDKCNPFNVLFSGDDIACLDVQLEICSTKEEVDPDFEELRTTDGIHVECLRIHSLNLSRACWKKMWNKVSQLKRLEQISLNLEDCDWMTLDDISMALNSVCLLPRLTYLALEAHDFPGTLDLTQVLLALLGKDFIECIYIRGYLNHDSHSYEIDAIQLIEGLKGNLSLQTIELAAVDLRMDAHMDVTSLLLNFMKQSNNVSLSSIVLNDKSYDYTGAAWATSRGYRHDELELPHKNYKDAYELEYLTGLNRFGLAKIQEKGVMLPQFVRILRDLYEGYFMDEEVYKDETCYRQQLLAIATEGNLDGNCCDSTQHLDKLYQKLLSGPEQWCIVLEEEVEYVAIMYGLLLAKPDLWCEVTKQDGGRRANRPLKRKRLH